MLKKYIVIISLVLSVGTVHAQDPRPDSLSASVVDDLTMDSTLDYDELLAELDFFLDSLLTPRSYFMVNLSVGQGYFNYINSTNTRIRVVQKFIWSPAIGYYSKGGFGFTATGNVIKDSSGLNLYQGSISPSFDFLKNRKFVAGIAFIKYFTKDSLVFYTSPLQNEINAYFIWRKSWLQPGIATSYGWGSRTEYKKRERLIDELTDRRFGNVYSSTEESILDFSVTGSLRHDFYWMRVFSDKDYMKLTPQLSFSAGTQKFGFNQTTGTYGVNGYNVLYSAGSVNLSKRLEFQPISLTLYLRHEYSIGKFYLQPQLLFDYYFPARSNNFTTLFSFTTGVML